VADKSSQLILTALTQAAATAAGMPLHGSKATPGLFPSTVAGKQAAQRCREEGFLAITPSCNGEDGANSPALKMKSASAELCMITDKGLAYLLAQVSPREVLEDLVRVLETRDAQVDQLLTFARLLQGDFQALKQSAQCVLERICQPERQSEPVNGTNGDLKSLFHEFLFNRGTTVSAPGHSSPAPEQPGIQDAVRAFLTHWTASCTTEDCPLPELFRQARTVSPDLTIGQFHDTLRQLHDRSQIYLHPWTGPLYDVPEPQYALLIGHEVAYYASSRS
jgi:hypothetical protein